MCIGKLTGLIQSAKLPLNSVTEGFKKVEARNIESLMKSPKNNPLTMDMAIKIARMRDVKQRYPEAYKSYIFNQIQKEIKNGLIIPLVKLGNVVGKLFN